MKLRQDLKRKKVEKLVYQDFALPEPNFVDKHDRMIFNMTGVNRHDLKINNNMTGLIIYMNNVTCSGDVNVRHGQGKDTNGHWEGYFCEFKFLQEAKKMPESKVINMLCPLTVEYGDSFQHFIDTVMPKLIQVYNYIIPADAKIIVNHPRRDDLIITEILHKLGFQDSQIIYLNRSHLYEADAMLDTCVAPKKHPDTWSVLRTMLGAHESLSVPLNNSLVILLTRAKSHKGGRRILNQKEVFQFLQARYGPSSTIQFAGGYNLSESIRLFGAAKIVLGVHGGAFYNLNFCPRGTHVVEVVPANEKGPTWVDSRIGGTVNQFWHEATMLGQVYWRVFERSINQRFRNVHITMSKLKALLDKIDHQLEVRESTFAS